MGVDQPGETAWQAGATRGSRLVLCDSVLSVPVSLGRRTAYLCCLRIERWKTERQRGERSEEEDGDAIALVRGHRHRYPAWLLARVPAHKMSGKTTSGREQQAAIRFPAGVS